MKIYNPQGIEIYDIAVDDSSVRYRSIMNDDSLTLNFSLSESITIPQYSYCNFEDTRYTLWRPQEFKKQNTRNHEYTLTLHGWREYLKFLKYKDMGAIPYRLKFSLTAKPVVFLTNLVNCLNAKDASGGWAVGNCIDAPEKALSFNHEFCIDALSRFAQEWQTEFEFDGKTIHLRKVEKFKADPLPLSYGKGNGFLPGVGRYNDGDKQPIGLLFVEGGERNIDFSKYNSKTLLLPKSATLVYDGKTFLTDAAGMYITRDGNNLMGEDSFDASHIYPNRVGTVSEVIVVDAAQNFYDIKDASIPETLNYQDCRIAGGKAVIKFESGALAGREFDIEQTETDLTGYIHSERRFKIVPAELDGVVMPGGVFIPTVGDRYAIFNINLPQAYISDDETKTGASWDMFREAARYFSENENDLFRFTGELDGVWSKSQWPVIGSKIVPGGHILFSDTQFQPTGVVIRIVAVKDYVNRPHKPEVTLSNASMPYSLASEIMSIGANVENQKNVSEQIKKAHNVLDLSYKNQKVGSVNLLRNASFLGNYASVELSSETTLTETSELYNKALSYWTTVGEMTIIDEPMAKSGKAVVINGSIAQKIQVLNGESYVLSTAGKGLVEIGLAGKTRTIDFGSEYSEKEIKFTSSVGGEVDFYFSSSGGTIFNPQLERGNVKTDFGFNPLDENPAFERLQAYEYILAAMKDGQAQSIGAMILAAMLQVGNYKDGLMQKVTGLISGLWNDDSDPFLIGGGNLEEGIRRILNPMGDSVDEDGNKLANFAVDHGGNLYAFNAFIRGVIHATSGYFQGKIESNINGDRITIDPETRSLKYIDTDGRLTMEMFFRRGGGDSLWTSLKLYGYISGKIAQSMIINPIEGITFEYFDESGQVDDSLTMRIQYDGWIKNGNMPRGATVNTMPATYWYEDANGFVKVKR